MPAVFVGLPVYHGWDMVGRALEALQAQAFGDFRVLISVDGDDRRSFEACLPYAEDRRFELVLQPRLLGWPGNLNWLFGQAREDFFCYCQQDNYYAPSYLRVLLDHARRHPEAAVVFCDIQSFGEFHRLTYHLEVKGSMQERVRQQIERANSLPHHGLIRREALTAAGPRWTAFKGAKTDSAWVVRLAREGELHRIPQPLCFKGVRSDSVAHSWRKFNKKEWREITLSWGLNVLEGALPAYPGADQARLLEIIVHRLIIGPKKRALYFNSYDPCVEGPDGPVRLVADFLKQARERYAVTPFPALLAREDAASLLAERIADDATPPAQALMAKAVLADIQEYQSAGLALPQPAARTRRAGHFSLRWLMRRWPADGTR